MQIIILSKYKISSLEIDESCVYYPELIFDDILDLMRDKNVMIIKDDERASSFIKENLHLKYKYKLNIEKC